MEFLRIPDGEGGGGAEFLEFGPADGSGDRRARAGAGGVGQDRGRAALVAEPVDEDLPLALSLRHGRDEAVGLVHRERFGEALGEILVRVPAVAGSERHDDVDALPAREQREAGEPDLAKLVGDVGGGLLHLREAEALVGVEVEDHAVGILDVRSAAGPAVKLDRAHLDALEQAARVGEADIVFLAAILLRDRNRHERVAEAAMGVFLEEAFLGAPLRAAHEADRAALGVGEEERGDRLVIVGKVALGRLGVGEDDAVAARDDDRGRGVAGDVGGVLVGAQTEEAGVAHAALGGELGEGDFGNEAGFEPGDAARRRLVGVDGSGLAFEAAHLRGEVAHLVLREAGADIALVGERAGIMLGDEQRGEGAAGLVAILEADDDEFVAADALHLEPCLGAARAVGGVGFLGDDAFAARPAHLLQQRFAIAHDMVGEMDGGLGLLEQRRQPVLAFEVAERGEILAFQFEEIEEMEAEPVALRLRPVAALEDLLEGGEVGIALGVVRDDFAVHEGRGKIERGNGLDERAELVGPVLAVARVDRDVAPIDRDQRAVAVILDLVEPGAALGHAVGERGELGLAIGGARHRVLRRFLLLGRGRLACLLFLHRLLERGHQVDDVTARDLAFLFFDREAGRLGFGLLVDECA